MADPALRPDQAHELSLTWIADQQRHHHRATGRGLSPAEMDRLHSLLSEVTPR